ncbi:hypothetical protein TSUD_409980 [Trifolium subterraneum]|uniref:hAT-like transposase RNase-H fold domain-containing protein n=1 Tax=Trifolium subterraneum TaxID=3900 RepID=A0A2Z6PHF1_TRISU|nr:hypothetical protein TSUD_409980 [Trifolium subterraneum]
MDDIGIDMDNESTQNEILEVNGDGSQPPIAAVGDGFQPSNATEATPVVEASLPPRHTKKTKPNANGPRKTAAACGKRYLCDPKSHGTTNLLAHSKICPKIPQILSNDPSQTVLTLVHILRAASHIINVEACNNMNGLVLDGEHLHLRCCSRILNLIVRDGLKTNKLVISKIRTAVRFVRSSSQRLAKFKECVGFAGITCRKSLCLDVITRWKSTYLMLESAEPFQVAFDKLDFEDPSYLKYFGAGSCPPNFDDWDKARAFMKFLKIFYDVTKFFSTSTHVSIHDEFHHLFEIHNDLKLAILDSDPNSQEDLDVSEKIVRELCESLASTSFGAGPSSAATPAVDPFAAGPSSQSRPFGRG